MNTTNLIDNLLKYLRKKTYFNFLESNENWLVKSGLFCLSYIIPILSIIATIAILVRAELNAVILWIPVIVCILSVLFRYTAEKMLSYVKDTINKATTKISSGALLDVLTVFIGFGGLVVLCASIYFAITTGDWNTFLSGVFMFIFGEYCMAMLLDPVKSINIVIEKNATPAENFVGIFSVLAKSLYRLVPVAFGSAMIFCVIHLLDILFVAEGTAVYSVMGSAYEAFYCFGMALLPLVGYLLFLFYYFTIDICVSFLQIPKKLEEISKQKK